MPVTLRWLLEQPDLDLRLLTGADRLDRVVRWAHAIDLADPSPWLDGDELVLTTGLRLPRSAQGRAGYVDRLVAKRAAALGFGVGLEHATVPVEVLGRCRSAGLPLVEVPLPIPFVAITQAVATRNAAQQNEKVQQTLNLQQQMTATALAEGVPGLASALAHALGCDVVVLDRRLDAVCVFAADPTALRARIRDELTRATNRTPPSSINVLDDDGALSVQSLTGRQAHLGWLAVRTVGSMHATDRLLVNQVASLLTLQLERRPDATSFENEVGALLLRRMVHGELADDPAAPAVLRRWGIPVGSPMVVIAVTSPPRSALTSTDLVGQALSRAGVVHLCCADVPDAEAVIYAMVAAQDAEVAVAEVWSDLTRGGRHDVGVGVSPPAPLRATHRSAERARRAARAAGWRRRGPTRFSDLPLGGMLDDPDVGPRLRAITTQALRPLLDLPEPESTELITGLEAFLHHHGSWEAASRAVGVHRHTLRTRMTRVEQVTGVSLDSAQDRTMLLLALLALAGDQPRRAWSSRPRP